MRRLESAVDLASSVRDYVSVSSCMLTINRVWENQGWNKQVYSTEKERTHSPKLINPSAPLSIPSIKCPTTPSIAPTSTWFLSCARIAAFAFFVPNVSPSAVRASLYCSTDGAMACSDLSAFTVCFRMCGDTGVGRSVTEDVRGLCSATRYLPTNYLNVRIGHVSEDNGSENATHLQPPFAALLLSSSLDTNSTLSVSPTTNTPSSASSFTDASFAFFRA